MSRGMILQYLTVSFIFITGFSKFFFHCVMFSKDKIKLKPQKTFSSEHNTRYKKERPSEDRQGLIQTFWEVAALYVSHHGWATKKILGFRWSKKANITLETLSFWQNISISIFSIFIYNERLPMKSYLSHEHNTNKFSLLTKCACIILN